MLISKTKLLYLIKENIENDSNVMKTSFSLSTSSLHDIHEIKNIMKFINPNYGLGLSEQDNRILFYSMLDANYELHNIFLDVYFILEEYRIIIKQIHIKIDIHTFSDTISTTLIIKNENEIDIFQKYVDKTKYYSKENKDWVAVLNEFPNSDLEILMKPYLRNIFDPNFKEIYIELDNEQIVSETKHTNMNIHNALFSYSYFFINLSMRCAQDHDIFFETLQAFEYDNMTNGIHYTHIENSVLHFVVDNNTWDIDSIFVQPDVTNQFLAYEIVRLYKEFDLGD